MFHAGQFCTDEAAEDHHYNSMPDQMSAWSARSTVRVLCSHLRNPAGVSVHFLHRETFYLALESAIPEMR